MSPRCRIRTSEKLHACILNTVDIWQIIQNWSDFDLNRRSIWLIKLPVLHREWSNSTMHGIEKKKANKFVSTSDTSILSIYLQGDEILFPITFKNFFYFLTYNAISILTNSLILSKLNISYNSFI